MRYPIPTAIGSIICRNALFLFAAFALSLLSRPAIGGGVTIITHGFDPPDASIEHPAPVWMTRMASSIAGRTGNYFGTSIWIMRVERTNPLSTQIRVSAFDHYSGPDSLLDSEFNGDAIILLDWQSIAGIELGGDFSTTRIAETASQYLLENQLMFLEQPVHLIGHSRGASVVSEMARVFSARGFWIDHVTFLDPHPVDGSWHNDCWPTGNPDFSDARVRTYPNTAFAEVYYRHDDCPGVGSEFFDVDGRTVWGAFSVELNESELDCCCDDLEHNDVHSWYFGTIQPDRIIWDGTCYAPESWYDHVGGLMGPRDEVGYNYSRVARGLPWVTPALEGYHYALGGSPSQNRPSWTFIPNDAEWPNALRPRILNGASFQVGDEIRAECYYFDRNSSGTLTFFLDQDENQFNGEGTQVGSPFAYSATPSGPWSLYPGLGTAGMQSGTYYLLARITNNAHTRYAYAVDAITLSNAGSHVITVTAGPNGSVAPSGNVLVPHGQSQTFNATPNSGFIVDRWTLDGNTAQSGGNAYTLGNVTQNHTLAVTFTSANYGDLIIDEPAVPVLETPNSSTMFRGRAPSNTYHVTWTNQATNETQDTGDPAGTTWADGVNLTDGNNMIVIRAYDGNGALIASASKLVIKTDDIRTADFSSTEGTYVASGSPNHTYSDSFVYVGYWSASSVQNERGFVKFDLTSIPSGSQIVSAEFRAVNDPSQSSGSTFDVTLYRASSPLKNRRFAMRPPVAARWARRAGVSGSGIEAARCG